MKQFYEDKLGALSLSMAEVEEERERLIHEIETGTSHVLAKLRSVRCDLMMVSHITYSLVN
jgi:hypothetical protein